jgi:hypothetical protein
MTAHELAKKLLEGPDVEVVFDDERWGDIQVSMLEQSSYDDDDSIPVVRLK